MAVLRKKTKAAKAQREASAAAAEARRAAQESATALRDLAQALVEQIRELGLDERTAEALERVKQSDSYAQLQERMADVSRRVAESEAFANGRETAARQATAAMTGLGTWLASGKRGEALGITQSTRRGGAWLWALLGVGIGYVIGILTAPREGREVRDQIASRSRSLTSNNGPVEHFDGDPGVLAPSGDPVLADKVRTRLGEDPRTADLPSLNINVIDGTAVVRGPLPEDTDREAIRDVVGSVDGVRDVDMELGPAAR